VKIKTVIFGVFAAIFFMGCSKRFFKAADKAYVAGLLDQPYDAIIVPGFPYNGQHWDRVHAMRIVWAKYLYQKGYARNIIFSGSAVATPYVESRLMSLYAEALGIKTGNLYAEEKAEHSTENVYYGYRLAKEKGFTKIALATDPYQSGFMKKFIRKFELPVALLPIVIDTLRTLDQTEPMIDPSSARVEGFVKLSDREGFLKRFRGTIGKNIVWHAEDLKKKKYIGKFKNRIFDGTTATH
jgi:uncharacterized SAM-binding protein YcdF (DUF218 family)